MTAAPIDDPLVRAFEERTLDPARFGHREHLYVAFQYLRAMPLEDALARYVGNLRRLAEALGAPGKFHATMTWAYVVLLDEAMHRPGAEALGFDELIARTPALADHRTGLLHDYYARDELEADEARRRFRLPRPMRRSAP